MVEVYPQKHTMTRSSTILRLSDSLHKRLIKDEIDKTVDSDDKSSTRKLNRISETSFGPKVKEDKNTEKRRNWQSNVEKRLMLDLVKNKKGSQWTIQIACKWKEESELKARARLMSQLTA